ncbi:MAG: hypothetical protein HUJ68_06200 [Clostridia bacterium]|nr:hypothetical protein [Clostridia bacterium]
MTKNKKIVAGVAIVVIALLAIIGGQAYARYVTEVKGTGVAKIASWNFKVNGNEEQMQEIELLSTYNNETLVDNKIAPGTTGKFNIIVDATGSEVGANYIVQIKSNSKKPQNLKFVYDGKKYDIDNEKEAQELADSISGIITANDENKQRTITIGWVWEYQTGNTEDEKLQNDLIDTKDSKEIQDYTFTVSVIGNQVQPE